MKQILIAYQETGRLIAPLWSVLRPHTLVHKESFWLLDVFRLGDIVSNDFVWMGLPQRLHSTDHGFFTENDHLYLVFHNPLKLSYGSDVGICSCQRSELSRSLESEACLAVGSPWPRAGSSLEDEVDISRRCDGVEDGLASENGLEVMFGSLVTMDPSLAQGVIKNKNFGSNEIFKFFGTYALTKLSALDCTERIPLFIRFDISVERLERFLEANFRKIQRFSWEAREKTPLVVFDSLTLNFDHANTVEATCNDRHESICAIFQTATLPSNVHCGTFLAFLIDNT